MSCPLQVLAQRVAGDQRLQLGHQRRMATELEIGVDTRLERFQTQLLEARDLLCGPWVEGEVRERRPAPQRQRLVQALGGAREGALGERAPALGQQDRSKAAASTLRGSTRST